MAFNENKSAELTEPTLTGGDPIAHHKGRGEGPSLPSREVLDLAHKIKADEAKEKEKRIAAVKIRKVEGRHRLLFQLGLAALLLGFLYAANRLYTENQAKTQVTQIENQLIAKINSAYQGDEAAYQEVVRRIPILTEHLLTSLNEKVEVEPEELQIDSVQKSAQVSSLSVPDLTLQVEPVPVSVYARGASDAPVLGTIIDGALVIDIEFGEQWSSVILSGGIGLWIHEDFVELVDDNILKVLGKRVNLRASPDLKKSSVVGRANDGEILTLISKSSPWFKVRPPSEFKAWVRTSEFKDMLQRQ